MALGEAFINVRADLKPFAKDLEKGLKRILLAAEKKIAAEGNFGRDLGASLHKNTRDGVSDGIEEGSDRGMRRGSKKALTQGQKFFAGLADFADDGLSAIPAHVKAGLLIAIIAAAAAAAPFVGGVLAAAITGAIGTAVVAGGIALAARLKVVQDQFKAVGRDILNDLTVRAEVFVDPLLRAGESLRNEFKQDGDLISIIFAEAAKDVEPLTEAITGLVHELLPGIEISLRKARPLIEALAQALPQLGRDLTEAFRIIADAGPEAALALRDLLGIIGSLIITTAAFINILAKLWYWMRIIGAVSSGDFAKGMGLIAQHQNDAYLASGQLSGGLEGDLNPALGKTAEEARVAALAISDLVTAQLKGLDATLDYEQAIDDLADSIHKGNKSFDEREQKGRDNLRLVAAAVSGAARQRDQEIADMQRTGRSIEEIDAKYQAEITTIEKLTGKNATQNQSLKDLFATARAAPGDVEVAVKTPGLDDAISGFNRLSAAIRGAVSSFIKAGALHITGSKGLQTAKQYAAGDIVSSPTLGVIAEAGYAEAVIPDPAVMPQRAMELSNKFGLTAMIAKTLGAGQPIVNVFIGQQRLEEIADFRISYNNQQQAMAMAQGPRGVL